MEAGILTLDDSDFRDKTVILRVDINSPIDQATGRNLLADDNRLRKSLPTIRELARRGARTAILAHQGDTEDYRSLVSLAPHAGDWPNCWAARWDSWPTCAGPPPWSGDRALRSGDLLLLEQRALSDRGGVHVRQLCEAHP
jgi:phosphoglycerate kinase